MSVGEYCTRNAVFVRSNESPLEAARVMREKNVGSVVIIDDANTALVPVGILTDRDIVIEIVAEEVEPNSVTVRDIICRTLVTVKAEDDLNECLKLMMRKGVRRAPVVDYDGSLIGIIAIDDYLEIIAEQLHDMVSLFKNQTSNGSIKMALTS